MDYMCWHACFWRYCLCLLDYFSANITLLNFRCKCGNCNVALLQNISECYCCCELKGYEESIKSDLVLQDLAPVGRAVIPKLSRTNTELMELLGPSTTRSSEQNHLA